jgi:hypothetical protein
MLSTFITENRKQQNTTRDYSAQICEEEKVRITAEEMARNSDWLHGMMVSSNSEKMFSLYSN